MPFRLSRRPLAGIGAAAVIVPLAALFALRGGTPPSVAAGASLDAGRAVADVVRSPWYGLRLLLDPVSFGEPATAALIRPHVDAEAGILVDLDSRSIIWERNPHEELSPASTIKLLTAMVVLENFKPDMLVAVTQGALGQAGDETK